MLITSDNFADYDMGFSAAINNTGWKNYSWWWQEGYNQAAAGWKKLALVIGAPPPDFKPWTPVTANDVSQYAAGYRGTSGPGVDVNAWWYRVGAWDRSKARAERALTANYPTPPPFHETPNTPPPVANQQPGQPASAVIFTFPEYKLRLSDRIAYETGWTVGSQGQPQPYGNWWGRDGYQRQQNGFPKQLSDGFVMWRAFSPLDQADIQTYGEGFAAAKSTTLSSDGFFDSLPWWYRQGLGDAHSGRGYQPYVAGQVPVGFPVVIDQTSVTTQTQPSGSPPTSPRISIGGRAIELYATIFGKPVPYDTAAAVGRIQGPGLIPAILGFGTRFELLGDAPGSQREGYGLSGPNGPIARKVARLIATGEVLPSPRLYRLPAWVGTRLRNGEIKLLGRGELQSIGVWQRLIDLFPLGGVF